MRQSIMNHVFSQVPDVHLPRARFDRSCSLKTTFDGDYLIPLGSPREILPGDTVSMKLNFFARLNTPLFPIMDNMFFETFFFFVPMRLVWDNAVKFFGEQLDPDDDCDYTIPVFDVATAPFVAGCTYDHLLAYMGLPLGVHTTGTDNINCLPARAYNLIWNEWFRDENLQDPVVVDKDDADSHGTDYVLLKRGKRHDYFTSCLPWSSKNNSGTAVTIPLGTSAPIYAYSTHNDGGDDDDNRINVYSGIGGTLKGLRGDGSYVNVDANPHGDGEIRADLSSATAATINELRQAYMTQALYERDARGGTRYPEIIRSHFQVTIPAPQWRSEYLGGGSTAININTVANTSPVKAADAPQAADINQGDLSAFGTVSGQHGFVKSFQEHGYLIMLGCVRADLSYMQGIEKLWSRQTRLDFYWPDLLGMGEQVVYNREIYSGTVDDANAFGYQERFSEYKYGKSLVTGAFNSVYASAIDGWHLAQEFGALPDLDSGFIEQATPFDRVVATPGQHHFKLDCYFDEQWVRCMPVFSIPGKIGL